MNAAEIIKRFEALKGLRSNWENQWQDAAFYCLPTKADVTGTYTPGQTVSKDNYDATARNSLQVFAAALHSYLTNPASKWFSIRTRERELMQVTAVKGWLRSVEESIYDTINGSNFSQQIHESYMDLGTMGTSVLYEEEDAKDVIRFYCRPMKEIYLSEGDDERVDTCYRSFKLNARQIFKRWGETSGEAVLKAIQEKNYEKDFDLIHCVYPRYDRDPGKKDGKNMPYASKYIEVSQKHELWEGGYEEFPYFTPRFSKKSGDTYGYSPAMVSMPDIKMLNAISKTMIRGAQKVVDPPVSIPNDGYLLPMNFNPSGVNYELRENASEGVKPIGNYGNIPVGLEYMQRLEVAIQKAFFVDVFLLMAQQTGQMTATEVVERKEEKMLIIGPVLGRLMSELLNPLIQRTVAIMARANKLPPPPQELQGKEYVIEYISPLAKAQRFQEINSLNGLMQFVGNIAQAKPEVLDKINVDKAVDTASEVFGVNPEVVFDDDYVGKVRQQRQELQNKAMMLQAAQGAGAAAKDLTQADKNTAQAKEGQGG